MAGKRGWALLLLARRGGPRSYLPVGSPIDDEIDSLYGLPIDEFTSARNALAGRLKTEGDKAGAERVKRLGKPTVSAWTVNQLQRRHAAQIDALVAASDAVREAQGAALGGGGAEEMRDAVRAQREALSRVMRAAGELLSAGGHPASDATLDRVSTSLQALAASGWPDGAVGRLEKDLEAQGFDALAGLLAGSGGPSPARPRQPVTQQAARVASNTPRASSPDVVVSYEGKDPELVGEDDGARERRAEIEAALEQARKRAQKARRDADEASRASARAIERATALRAEADDAARRAEEARERAAAADAKAEAATVEARDAAARADAADRDAAEALRHVEAERGSSGG
jgi:hypothetical protein